MARPLIVGIGGPSGSGKTTIANAICLRFGPERCAVLRLDDYYRDLAHIPLERRAQWNFDAPDAIEIELLVAQAETLSRGGTIHSPTYDFVSHSRKADTRCIGATAILIIEGTLALHWRELRAHMGIRAYVHAEERLCFERRLDRDVNERGRSTPSVLDQWQSTVWPMHVVYVLPSRAHADLVLDGSRLPDAAATLAEEIAQRIRV